MSISEKDLKQTPNIELSTDEYRNLVKTKVKTNLLPVDAPFISRYKKFVKDGSITFKHNGVTINVEMRITKNGDRYIATSARNTAMGIRSEGSRYDLRMRNPFNVLSFSLSCRWEINQVLIKREGK